VPKKLSNEYSSKREAKPSFPVKINDITNCTVTFSQILRHVAQPFWAFLIEIYFTDSIYSVQKDKLQNYSCNQFE